MKKLPGLLLLSLVFAMLLCVSAFAADQGICAATAKDGINVSFQYYKADGTEVTAATEIEGSQVYEDAVKIEVTYTGTVTADAQYLFVVQNTDTTAPTSGTIVYIDQDAAKAGTVTFTAYPSELTGGRTYHIYLASSDTADGAIKTLTEIAEYSCYAEYTPGDVDESGAININDAMAVINHITQKAALSGKRLLAADVNGDNAVNINDVMEIINYIAKKPSVLENR